MAHYALVAGLVVKPLDDCRAVFDPGTGDTHFVPAAMAVVIDELQRSSLSWWPESAGSPVGESVCWPEPPLLEQFLTNAVQAGILRQS
jgi:hypothetical protein